MAGSITDTQRHYGGLTPGTEQSEPGADFTVPGGAEILV